MSAPAQVVDEMVAPLALQMLACLRQEVARTPDPPGLVSLRPGTQVEFLLSLTEDECCLGLGWVRVGLIYPSTDNFPLPDQQPSHCGILRYGVQLEIGVGRCAPRPAAEELVGSEEWDALSLAILNDRAALARTVCCFTDLPANRDRLIYVAESTPLPVDGGCVGRSQIITVAVDNCDCPEPDPADQV